MNQLRFTESLTEDERKWTCAALAHAVFAIRSKRARRQAAALTAAVLEKLGLSKDWPPPRSKKGGKA